MFSRFALPSSISTIVTRSAIFRFCSAVRPSTQVICTCGISLLLGIYDSPCVSLPDPSILSASHPHSFSLRRMTKPEQHSVPHSCFCFRLSTLDFQTSPSSYLFLVQPAKGPSLHKVSGGLS